MTAITIIRTVLLTAVATCVLASSAVAAGEPKNESPFNQFLSSARGTTVVAGLERSAKTLHMAGEPKNQLPFTRR
jgi:hypothetical protein